MHLLHLIATFAPKRMGARSTILQRSLFGRHAILSLLAGSYTGGGI